MPISLLQRTIVISFLFAAGMHTPAYSQTQNSSIPVESFFKNSQLSNVTFSPDGKTIAMLAAGANDRLVLATMDSTKLQPSVLAKYEKTDVISFQWVNNNRLVFSVGDRGIGDGERYTGSGLFAINKDGSDFRQIIETKAGMSSDGSKFRVLNIRHGFLDTSHIKDSNDIYVTRNAGNRANPALTLLKVNTLTGYNEAIPSPSNATGFMIDKSGELRVTTTSKDNLTGVHYKDPKSGEWRKLIEYDSVKQGGFTPEFLSPDGQLYVLSNNGKDTASIYRYDLNENKIDSMPVISSEGFDFSGSFKFNRSQNKLLGISYESDAYGTVWLDQKFKDLQKTIDSYLPNTTNIISVAETDESKLTLVRAFSDVHPGSYLIFNNETKKFTPIGDVKPEINSKQMSYQDFVKVKARDGLEIPTYITIPKESSGKNLPAVIMVHGGPYVRGGHWGWNPQTQFLASRGYVVIEPDFRGSTGYGNKLFKAGWKQWGLAMQDDVTDVTKWAIDKGYIDAKRICIAGASYGGYATLMGLIKEPNLYQCGISWVGVTDINYLFDVSWSDTAGTAWAKYGMPSMIGDQEKDAAQLNATSPVKQAHRLTKPLILAYGAADVRVPLVHGEKFMKAAPADAQIEWITYAEEGHGWRTLKNNVDFWTRVEKFLNKHTAANK